jgi:hypothetical protein
MVLSTRWLAPLALGATLLAAAPSGHAQNDAQAGAAAEPRQGLPENGAGGAESAAAADAAASGGSAAQAAARAEDLDRSPHDCVVVSNIRQTVVLDDQTILFYMRGGKKDVYRNYLTHECPNLGREGRFAYEVRMNQICNIDLITVIQQFGPQLGPGFTCRLGDFYPMTYEEAEILRKEKAHPDGPHGNAIKSKPAEVPAEKSGAAGEPASPGDAAR